MTDKYYIINFLKYYFTYIKHDFKNYLINVSVHDFVDSFIRFAFLYATGWILLFEYFTF